MPDPAGPNPPILSYRGPVVAEPLPATAEPPVLDYRRPHAKEGRSSGSFRRRVRLMFDLYWLTHMACVLWVLVCVSVAIAAVIHACFEPDHADGSRWSDFAAQLVGAGIYAGAGIVALVSLHVLWRWRWHRRIRRRGRPQPRLAWRGFRA